MPSQLWSVSGQKAYCCIAASIALSSGTGAGSSYSSWSLVKVPGTAPYSSYQYFEMAISSGFAGPVVPVAEWQVREYFPRLRDRNTGKDQRMRHVRIGIPVARITVVVESAFRLFINIIVVLPGQLVKDGFPSMTGASSSLLRNSLTFSRLNV